MDLDTVADELYGLRPEDFTPARDARVAEARAAGDRTLAGKIGKLRKPSLSAWASNLLVREQPEETASVLRLGEGLRQAHRDLDGAQLRELSRQQHVVINELSRQARRLADRAGHPISDTAQHEVETILHAVLADTGAAEEWATGRLVKAFDSVAGFPTAAEGARPRPARTTPRKEKAPPAKREAATTKADQEHHRRLEQARQKAEDAERELKARQDEAAQADQQAADAQTQAATLQQRVTELTEELRRLEKEQQQAETAVRKARDRAGSADRAVRAAQRRFETATERLTRLTGESRRTGTRSRTP
ncbi:hypothetical protein LXH13_37790 [Streptomyces spinosirectus]|uniref:hypothetical protein n=1 Tax=Streptomyces TaxID=1883 RepID=UPI001C9D7F04|nr:MULTISPECIES: hypothetical protein [Streptomyces]MBY8343744.1 hypothetical protein [Streptomyces plumbidurans]UIR22443.1 hypothetical protein LXH13_37790 [Streptomyces spinosirectus]